MEGRITLGLASGAVMGATALLAAAPPLAAQTVLIRGRVEDAVSRTPLADVAVFPADSSTVAVTDPLGTFTLEVPSARPIIVLAERVGYETIRFELPEGDPSRRWILLLEPAPIELEGIEVISESALSERLRDLKRRRNAYYGPVTALDRTQLERLARFGTVWDIVRRRVFQAFECGESPSGLCVRSLRGRRSIEFREDAAPVLVCIDGRESWGAVAELNSLDIESVALVEIYNHGRGGIRVYTPGYIASSARAGRSIAPPIGLFGARTC